MTPTVTISVIVPVYNAEETISSCLKSLFEQSIPKTRYEIIVVDDGSTDHTRDIVTGFDVHYMFQHNQGPASARNQGAHAASGELILFTDSDCIPSFNWIEEMIHPFDHSEITGVKGAYRTIQKSVVARFAQMEFEDRYDLLQKRSYIDMVDTYSAAYRKHIFLSMGLFDQRFTAANGEDMDFSCRLFAAGYRLVFNPNAIVFHKHADRIGAYLNTKFRRAYWRMSVYQKHPDRVMKDTYTPIVLKIETVLMMLSMMTLSLFWFSPTFTCLTFFIWSLILVLSVPFAIKTFRKDKWVGVISPFIISLRSLVFAWGSGLGILRTIISQSVK
jgi:glycosyltransferase involved in cell wall biosynthesis